MTKADGSQLACSINYNSIATVSAVITWYDADGQPVDLADHDAFTATATVCGSTSANRWLVDRDCFAA